ncbi:MAG: DUF2330 domain-containing protein [Alphaproteobacteria bacterium]|nr:DUF2330 domain-containing protein [Alphaproteobacteria bacterium]
MKRLLLTAAFFLFTQNAHALPGFFIGKDDTAIISAESKIIIATANNHTVMTIMPSITTTAQQDFSLLIPVPATLTRENITQGSAAAFDALDAASATHLIEKSDRDPCTGVNTAPEKDLTFTAPTKTIDARYDITLLSIEQATALPAWLTQQGYTLPEGAEKIIAPYAKKNMGFIVATIRRDNANVGFLPPLQLSYDAPMIALPLQLSAINAPAITTPSLKSMVNKNPGEQKADIFNDGTQALTLYVVTQQGHPAFSTVRSTAVNNPRAQTTLPASVKNDFSAIAQRILNMRAKAESNTALIEYAGAAELSDAVLKSIGASWSNSGPDMKAEQQRAAPMLPMLREGLQQRQAIVGNAMRAAVAAGKPFLTRLYLRYSASSLPQDLSLRETSNRQPVETRYTIHAPWLADPDPKNSCEEMPLYQKSVAVRDAHALETLSRLTGQK